MEKVLKNVTITSNVTKGRSVQETKEILSYMLVASLVIQQQILSPTATTVKPTTTSQKFNNYEYYYYYEESNPITSRVGSVIIFPLFIYQFNSF